MQLYSRLLTSLVFAAHAMLGCGAHRTCDHSSAIVNCAPSSHAVQECVAHQSGHGEKPSHHGHEPSAPGSHSVCSYVKAETQRIDLSNDVAALFAAIAPVDPIHDGIFTHAVGAPICRADLSSTQLYVWHCALII